MSSLTTYGTKVEFAFGEPPVSPVTWTDVTTDVQSVQIDRGRNSALDHFDTGTATIVLRNDAAQYDPLNQFGPYYGDLVPRVPCRISMTNSSSTRKYLFRGHVQARGGWSLQYSMPHASQVTVKCADWLSVLAQTKLHTSFSVELFDGPWQAYGPNRHPVVISAPIPAFAGDRAGMFLDHMQTFSVFPIPEVWSFEAGMTFVQGWVANSEDCLSYLQMVAETEGGAIYVLGDGTLRFDGRLSPVLVTRQKTSQATYSDDLAHVNYADIQMNYGAEIWNRATITPQTYTSTHLVPQTFSDATSIASYFVGEQTRDGLIMDSIPEALARAENIVYQYKTPLETPASLTLTPLRSNSVRDGAVNRELRDRVTVAFKPPGVASRRTVDCYVESIHHAFNSHQVFTTTFGLSTVSRYAFADSADFITLDNTQHLDGSQKWAV